MLTPASAARSFSDRPFNTPASPHDDSGYSHQHAQAGDSHQPVSYFDTLMRLRVRPSARRATHRN